MKIKLNIEWFGHKPGEVIEVDRQLHGLRMVSNGSAVEVKETKPMPNEAEVVGGDDEETALKANRLSRKRIENKSLSSAE